jgi:hypothetical protein
MVGLIARYIKAITTKFSAMTTKKADGFAFDAELEAMQSNL